MTELLRSLSYISLATTLLLTACQSQPQLLEESTLSTTPSSALDAEAETKEPATKEPREGTTPSFQSGLPSHKIIFREADGTPEFSLQFKPTGGKLIDRSGKVITSLIIKGDGSIQLNDINNKTVGYIARRENAWHIENPKRSKTLFTFRREDNGNATLSRAGGSAIYDLKATEDGYTVAAGKAEPYTVSSRKGTGHLQTSEGETIIATDSAIEPVALASFGFTQLTQAQQAGLAYALSNNVL